MRGCCGGFGNIDFKRYLQRMGAANSLGNDGLFATYENIIELRYELKRYWKLS